MITKIFSFFIPPYVDGEEELPFPGTEIPLNGKAFDFLQEQYSKAKDECRIPIVFIAKDDQQANDVRDSVIKLLKRKTLENASLLATRLWRVTDARPGHGLMFLIMGKTNGLQNILIARYAADTGFTANATKSSLSVALIENIFLKNVGAYKAALYEGSAFETDFWEGLAIDKQNRTFKELSDYWIKNFLESDFKISPKRGSMMLGKAVRKAILSTENLSDKHDIISTIALAKNLNGKAISATDYCSTFSLSEGLTNHILNSLGNETIRETKFIFESETFKEVTAIRTIYLNNGAIVSGDAEQFSSIWEENPTIDENIEYKTKGKIINEKVRTKL
ncbi:hypothetical protein EFP84_18885 [Leptospira kmetyi]|uniref:Uncharacterized protein n=1 Tax=Leptospira kmetyi TaxID=408139 RepID=A0AAD0UR69_9LEPT|nr:hypothetical protein [Leptospira kmetyi]AYV57706.1 hypothetical protein EFP84_18885 [Leptospira kmetyi]